MPPIKRASGKAAKRAKPAKTLEQTLWEAADKMRGNLEAAEYKHVVLGLVFLKYVSDAFEHRRRWLEAATADETNTDYYVSNPAKRDDIVEARDEYTAENVFWVPAEARWAYLQDRAKQPEIGTLIDAAMDLIEKENPTLKGVLPKTYARTEIDKRLLGELVDLIGTIGFTDVDHGADDVLGRVYEYFLGRFAAAEGRNAGEFYTPRSVVRVLVEMLEPFEGRVFDPCCGSGGMFVQSDEFVAAHGGKRDAIAIYGQEFVATTWRLAKMNLALRGIDANLADRADDAFHRDLFPDLRADFILANPPFTSSHRAPGARSVLLARLISRGGWDKAAQRISGEGFTVWALGRANALKPIHCATVGRPSRRVSDRGSGWATAEAARHVVDHPTAPECPCGAI